MNNHPSFDIVVAGGGHNSLISAAYLAKAGLRVLVLEAKAVVGGNTMTEELTLPGFLHDTCSSAHTLIQSSPTIRNNELGLDKYGLKYLKPDPVVTMPFADGKSITMWRDIEKTEAEFAKFSSKDAKAYRQMMADYDEVKHLFGQYRYTPIGYGPTLDELLATHPKGHIWQRRYRQSALDILKEYFEDPHILAFMTWLAFMTITPIDVPGTGRLAYALAFGRQSHSWVTPVGGSIALPNALIALIEDHGGMVLPNQEVTRLIVEDGRCVGVETAVNQQFHATKAVLSTIHVKHLVEMAPREAWDDGFLEGVANWDNGFTLFVSHYATTEPPLFMINGNLQGTVAAGICGSGQTNDLDNLLQLHTAYRQGTVHTDPPLLVICSSVADDSRAPEGHHTLKILSFYPYDLKEGVETWDQIKEQVGARNLEQLRQYAPNLTDDKIVGQVIESPLDLSRINLHNWHGSCHGGAMLPYQSGAMRPALGWASHKMPIKGLYQTGATTHPGGSVSGGPGRNAAWVILDDLGMDFQTLLVKGN